MEKVSASETHHSLVEACGEKNLQRIQGSVHFSEERPESLPLGSYHVTQLLGHSPSGHLGPSQHDQLQGSSLLAFSFCGTITLLSLHHAWHSGGLSACLRGELSVPPVITGHLSVCD